MIQLIACKYSKQTAYILSLIFMTSLVTPAYGSWRPGIGDQSHVFYSEGYPHPVKGFYPAYDRKIENHPTEAKQTLANERAEKPFIGGPSQPEMSTFKPIDADNMVSLFTGDFSYNIPLLDVGGYPVNIFYNGGIGMEQEASWVGLGWNINPGTVSRNMRGVPDDFNGQDTMVQIQKIKPNKTWNFGIGADVEACGFKFLNGNARLGVSFNNYLGPAIDFSIKGGLNFKLGGDAGSEKMVAGASVGLKADLNSRDGLTLTPNVSLSAKGGDMDVKYGLGIGLSTSYNSRTGLKALQISEQVTANYNTVNDVHRNKDGEVDVIGYYDKAGSSISPTIASAAISFTKPSYVPAIRLPITNSSFAGHFQLGGAMSCGYGSGELEIGFQKSEVADADVVQKKPMIGYIYYQNSINNPNAIMDFTRLNDGPVTPNTSIISAPQYSYDVYSIQGEGTGGTIRPYRNDMGYVRDNYTRSKDKSLDIGVDIGIPGHYGANLNLIKTPSTIGEWNAGNYLRNTVGLGFTSNSGTTEAVYFRNPGETSVMNGDQYSKIGGTDLVRYKLGGSNFSPAINPVLERFTKDGKPNGTVDLRTTFESNTRKKRTQVTSFLTADEARKIGLDTVIKSYSTTTLLDHDTLSYESFPRVGGYRHANHISQFNVTEADGQTYVYGIPVYSIVQRDFTFSVANTPDTVDKVSFNPTDTGSSSTLLQSSSNRDGYIQEMQTPAYAHSFLLSALLSPDYVDVTGNGVTEDDLGNAVKFNYTRIKQSGNWAVHKWRSPMVPTANLANFNPGNRTEVKDDKGIISYGERESWYLHSVESKTMIAVFRLSDRNDGKGASGTLGGVNSLDASLKKLDRIDLYSKADLKKNGTNARPIKSVNFEYDYSLCTGTPDNTVSNGGKLTLTKIYFTFNGQARTNKTQYVFNYGNTASSTDNPAYAFNASDRWGNYKPRIQNPIDGTYPTGMKNSDYPYATQNKTNADNNSQAWMLKKILLPSGGQMEITYEGDDYAYVQDRRATAMMTIAGFGTDSTAFTNRLYNVTVNGPTENDYVFITVPSPCTSKQEVLLKYLKGIQQIAFKLAVIMPKGVEYIRSYATYSNWGYYNSTTIWIKVDRIDGMTPMTQTALQYVREQLPGQAFSGYDVSGEPVLTQIGDMLLGWLDGLNGAFKDPAKYLKSKGLGQYVVVGESVGRVNVPLGYKYGGGFRVKSVKLKDNWDRMTGQFGSFYGKEYDYRTTETFNGSTRTISSGVASYEPSLGGEENPFQTILQVVNKVPLGPASYGAVEMPVLDAYFPAPVVGYSKVTVRSLKKAPAGKKSRSGVGKQVTEFYTAKDYPVYYSQTGFDPASDKQAHQSSLGFFFYKSAYDTRALSQGFLVETNDMHGKMKSQSSYAENDTLTRINYTESFYRNTGKNGMNETFSFVTQPSGGMVSPGNMGIDIELMTDTREFGVKTKSFEIQAQLDWVVAFPPIWLPFIWPVIGESENTYRAVTTTKVINYHGILDSTVVIDKGSQVSTKNTVYDAETGSVVVNKTNNEFNQAIYTTTYPAYWAYSGMGLAYKNIDAVYSHVDFLNGKIINGISPTDVNLLFESGDELYIMNAGSATSCPAPSSSDERIIWALDSMKNSTSLSVPNHNFIFLDKSGNPYNRTGVQFRIVRSGHRNMLSATVAGITSMTNPVVVVGGPSKIIFNNSVVAGTADKVLNASAVEYKETWQTDNEVIKRLNTVYDSATCSFKEVVDCSGYLEERINPYRKGLLGNFRTNRSMVFYSSRIDSLVSIAMSVPEKGYLANFGLYWDFGGGANNLIPAITNLKWVWNSQITRVNARGLELETKDALNIYAAAQYGYQKTLPVSVANNARYDEIAYDGFEDNDYAGSLNTGSTNTCARPHVDFRTMSNSWVSNTDTMSINAHTGKYVLKVPGGSTASEAIGISPQTGFPNYDYQLKTSSVTLGSLYDQGIFNVSVPFYSNGSSNNLPALSYSFFGLPGGQFWCHVEPTVYITYSSPNYIFHLHYQIVGSQYYEATTDGYYLISLTKTSSYRADAGTVMVQIWDTAGHFVKLKILANGSSSGSNGITDTICLPKGKYRMDYTVTEHIDQFCNGTGSCVTTTTPPALQTIPYREFSFNISKLGGGPTMPGYKSLLVTPTCTMTLPIPGKDSMVNSEFAIPATKKMLFSAWVRESNTQVSNYANNQVQVDFGSGNPNNHTMTPVGPIIEGWQRYEDTFTAPVSVPLMTLKLVNSSGQPIYFDDIRIHPFNANMKSYVYDPVNLRLVAELDANNYAAFYEYDEEGGLIRTKAEAKDGVKTIKEARSAKQKNITTIQ